MRAIQVRSHVRAPPLSDAEADRWFAIIRSHAPDNRNRCLLGHVHEPMPQASRKCEYCGSRLTDEEIRHKGKCDHCYAPIREELRPQWCAYGGDYYRADTPVPS